MIHPKQSRRSLLKNIALGSGGLLTTPVLAAATSCSDILNHLSREISGRGIHEMGTARMGYDPKTSGLNKWNQVWDAPNVFVTDGSFMTSSACVNPSLSYMAFTARAVDHAVSELKKKNL